MNKEIKSSIQVNQWTNSSAVIKRFRNTENKPNCSFITFNIQDFYPSILLSSFNRAIEQLNLEKKSTIYQIIKFLLLCNQGNITVQ